MDFEKDATIDENALDLEWLNQPELAVKYGKHWAECARAVQQAEEAIKLIRSELIKEAHADADELFGVPKPTGPVVEAYYREHVSHRTAKNKLIDAQYELNIAEIAKKEISITRRNALENLVTLHGQNYFAGPSVPRDLSFEASEKRKTKESNAGVSDRLKEKRISRKKRRKAQDD